MKDSKERAKSSSSGFFLAGVLALLVLAAAYLFFFYSPSSNFQNPVYGDGICDLGENCYDYPADCYCVAGTYCSSEEKRCVEETAYLPDNVAPSVFLSDCGYDSASDSIICQTNCQSSLEEGTTLVVVDRNGSGNISLAREGKLLIGQITLEGGRVVAHMDDWALLGSVKLSGLDQDTSQWIISINCKNPEGNVQTFGATKQ